MPRWRRIALAGAALILAGAIGACRTMDDTIEIPEPLPGPNAVQAPTRYRLLNPYGRIRAQAAQVPTRAIPRVAQAPAIDGQLDEDIWQNQPGQAVNVVYGGDRHGQRRPATPATVRFAWDETYLYIAYECHDQNLVAWGNGRKQGPPDNRREGVGLYSSQRRQDRMQFFILFDSTRFFWEIHHDAANHLSDSWIMVPDKQWPIYQSSMAGKWKIAAFTEEFIQDQKDIDIRTGETIHATLATAVQLADGSTISTNRGNGDQDHGYTAELRLPWQGLGAPIARQQGLTWDMLGQQMRILAVCENGDLEHRYHCNSSALQPGWLHANAPRFPVYELKARADNPE